MAAYLAQKTKHTPYMGAQIPKSLTKILRKSYGKADSDADPTLTPELLAVLKDYGYVSARHFTFENEEGIYFCRTPSGKSCKQGEMCIVFPYPFVVAYNAVYSDMEWHRVLLRNQ